MALYAIGDLHLSFSVDKPMEVFDPIWKGHEKKLLKQIRKRVKDEDTLLLTGDHSWGRNLSECEEDLRFIEALPGRKILLRGNHDMFWDAKKTKKLNDLYKDRLFFLQDNYAVYEDIALVGTKGYCYEGKDSVEHFFKIRDRELLRLRHSFELAKADGYEKFIMLLHYPPTSIGEMKSPFTQMAKEYGAMKVIYSHCHGNDRFDDSYKGMVDGIDYHLVSADFLRFKPERIL